MSLQLMTQTGPQVASSHARAAVGSGVKGRNAHWVDAKRTWAGPVRAQADGAGLVQAAGGPGRAAGAANSFLEHFGTEDRRTVCGRCSDSGQVPFRYLVGGPDYEEVVGLVRCDCQAGAALP
jgi:hypothetical protein